MEIYFVVARLFLLTQTKLKTKSKYENTVIYLNEYKKNLKELVDFNSGSVSPPIHYPCTLPHPIKQIKWRLILFPQFWWLMYL